MPEKKNQTITTSISGRGVDIQLGEKKSIPDEQLAENKKLNQLVDYLIGTERMESRRVDNQARGRSDGTR